jgi:hypothetical protein
MVSSRMDSPSGFENHKFLILNMDRLYAVAHSFNSMGLKENAIPPRLVAENCPWHLADELPALKVRCERGADVMLAASGDNKEIFIEVMPMPCFA